MTLVDGQHVGGGADLGGPLLQPVGRHVQVQQDVFELANRGLRGEDAQNVKAEGGRELEARQHQNLVPQATIFIQLAALVGAQAVLRLQPLQALDLLAQLRHAGDGVVVGDGHHVQPALLAFIQPIEPGRAWLLPVGRSHGVQMQIHAPPLATAALLI